MKRIIPLAIAMSLVAAACGGDSSSNSTTTTTTLAPSTTTTTAPTTTTTVAVTTTIPLVQPVNPNLGSSDTITTGGFGPIRIGMNPQEANIAAGYGLAIKDFVDESCYYLGPEPVLDNLGFMVSNGTIARVDVFPGGTVTSRSGAKIGMTEAQIIGLFGDQIKPEPHKYVTGGKYLVFVPVDEADKNFRVVFETDANGVVTSFRAGRLPEVEWVEGCL